MVKKQKNWVSFLGILLGVVSIIFSFIPKLSGYTLTVFLLSVFTLYHEFYSKINDVLNQTRQYTSEMSIDVKNHLTVIRIPGSIINTFNKYVINRLNIIKSIKNTSFNLANDHYEADELFNHTNEIKDAPEKVGQYIFTGLKWEDVGDRLSAQRFRLWDSLVTRDSKGSYSYKFLDNQVPYPNFMIIKYIDDREEVLFNWDVRSAGHEPKVLVSSEPELVDFYKAQFKLLFDNASMDADKLD